MAAKRGHVGVVRLLLESGPRGRDTGPNAKDDYGRTPLHAAAKAGHARVVRLLVRRFADTRARGTTVGLLDPPAYAPGAASGFTAPLSAAASLSTTEVQISKSASGTSVSLSAAHT